MIFLTLTLTSIDSDLHSDTADGLASDLPGPRPNLNPIFFQTLSDLVADLVPCHDLKAAVSQLLSIRSQATSEQQSLSPWIRAKEKRRETEMDYCQVKRRDHEGHLIRGGCLTRSRG